MRLGVFGGTFDPVHLGHLILAEQCREQARLDQVLFVVAARPPHKREQPLTAFDRRVEMLALALAGQPAFQIELLERDRPGPSYTVETLRELHQRRPGDDLFLIIGADSVQDLPLWYAPEQIVTLATLLVVGRPGFALPGVAELRAALRLPGDASLRMEVVHSPLIEIASRDLRQRVHDGHGIRYQVPRAVEAYIEEKRLYRE